MAFHLIHLHHQIIRESFVRRQSSINRIQYSRLHHYQILISTAHAHDKLFLGRYNIDVITTFYLKAGFFVIPKHFKFLK